MKRALLLLGVPFVAILAVVVGQRLPALTGLPGSTEAMAVVVGAVCGVAASVPVSLGLLLLLPALAGRSGGRLPGLPAGAPPLEPARRDTPPVVAVTPKMAPPTQPGALNPSVPHAARPPLRLISKK